MRFRITGFLVTTTLVILVFFALTSLLYLIYKKIKNKRLKVVRLKGSGFSYEVKLVMASLGMLIVFASIIFITVSIDNYKYKSFYVPIELNVNEVDLNKLNDNIKLNSKTKDSVYLIYDSEMIIITDKDGKIKDFLITIALRKHGKIMLFQSEFDAKKERIKFVNCRQVIEEDVFINKASFSEYLTLINHININKINMYFSNDGIDNDLSFNFIFDYLSNGVDISGKSIDPIGNIYLLEKNYQGIFISFYVFKRTYYEDYIHDKSIEKYLIIPWNKYSITCLFIILTYTS